MYQESAAGNVHVCRKRRGGLRAIAARLGLGPAQSWSADEAIAAWGRNMATFSLGSSSRVRGKAAADLGWSPKRRLVIHWIAEEFG
jgi:hypothetical protein